MRKGVPKQTLKRLQSSKPRRSPITKPSLHPRIASKKSISTTNTDTLLQHGQNLQKLSSQGLPQPSQTTTTPNLRPRSFRKFMQLHPLSKGDKTAFKITKATWYSAFTTFVNSLPTITQSTFPHMINLPFVNVISYLFSGVHRHFLSFFQRTLRGRLENKQQPPHTHPQPHIDQPLTYQGLKQQVARRQQQLAKQTGDHPTHDVPVNPVVDGSSLTQEFLFTLDGLLQHHPLNLALQRQYHALFGSVPTTIGPVPGIALATTTGAMTKISQQFTQALKHSHAFNTHSINQFLQRVASHQRAQFSQSVRGRQLLQGYALFSTLLPPSHNDPQQQQQQQQQFHQGQAREELRQLQELVQLNPSFATAVIQEHTSKLSKLQIPHSLTNLVATQLNHIGPHTQAVNPIDLHMSMQSAQKVPKKVVKQTTLDSKSSFSFFQLKEQITRLTAELESQISEFDQTKVKSLPLDLKKARQFLFSLHNQRKRHNKLFKQLQCLKPIDKRMMPFIRSHRLHLSGAYLSTHPIFEPIFHRFLMRRQSLQTKASRAISTSRKLQRKSARALSNAIKAFRQSQQPSSSPHLSASSFNSASAAATYDLFEDFHALPLSQQQRPITTSRSKHSSPTLSQSAQTRQAVNELNTQARRQFGILNNPKTEALSRHHFSTYSEMTPFRLHVSDSLRSVTKFAFMNTSALKPLKVTNIRPVLMPFWGFQGQFTIKHKSSKSTKSIDYTDVERNTDVAQYCQLLNVREDELYYGMAPIKLTNPNISFGQDFVHVAKDQNGRRAELYSTQPNTINTLRMRAQQLCSGSEWAPWITESLKTHIQMAKVHDDSMLQFPSDPINSVDFDDYKAQSDRNAEAAPRETDEDGYPLAPEDRVNYTKNLNYEIAKRKRSAINPLNQSYRQTVELEDEFKVIAPRIKALTKKHSGVKLETDEHIRSERASLIEALVNMTMLEFNLIQRGVGMTITQDSIEKGLNSKHKDVSKDHDPDNTISPDMKHSVEFEDPKTIHGAFLSQREQKDMLREFAQIHHKINGSTPDMNNNDNDSTATATSSSTETEQNPLGLQHFTKTNCPYKKFSRTFGAPTNDPIDFLQHQLLDDKLSLQTIADPSNSAKFSQLPAQKELRAKLRKEILHQFLQNQVQIDSGNKSIKFDIPGTDYEVSFNGITSRKLLYPGYINEYNYLRQKWHIMTSAVTGVAAGIQHRHYTAVATNALKNVIGAGFAGAGLRFALKRLALPPIYTAAATIVLIIWSLREVLSGHVTFQQNQSEYAKMLDKEYKNEQQLYSTLHSKNKNGSPGRQPAADEIRDSWEFHPYVGFYTMNNLKAQHMWECLSRVDNPKRSTQREKRKAWEAEHPNQAKKNHHDPSDDEKPKDPAEERFRQQQQQAQQQKRMRDMPTPLPTDPYVLIFGEEFFNIKPGQSPNLTQVAKLTTHQVKTQYMKELKKWHPDFYNPAESIYSEEYVEQRTRDLIEAFDKINTDSKKSTFDRQKYRP